MVQWRYALILPLIVLFFALVGGFYGPMVRAAADFDAEEFHSNPEMENFIKALNLVQQNAAESVKSETAIDHGAIAGMLRELDPHSNFFDRKEYQTFKEEQRGSYFGVGMEVGPSAGKTMVKAPFPGSPAYKVGIRPGDIIVSVDQKSVEGLNTSEVADLLKGPRGKPVTISISREGVADLMKFTVVRDEISRKSVPEAFFVRPGIAYVKILLFGESTGKELDDSLRRLGEDSIRGLVLDLRGNPGGSLKTGVAVADHFLRRNQLIVSHSGRASQQQSYFARSGNHGREYPMVVLVDRNSASAAEIVSGALQDHDRAWILGEKTFGKGLVQTVFPLRDDTALALTTAHFYTPSGRLIQRDYTNKSFYEYYNHKDPNAQNLNDVKKTDGGRTVYGGGGITPDEKYENTKFDGLETQLFRTELFSFTRSHFSKHSASLPKGWMPDEAVLNELHQYLLDHHVKFTDEEFAKDHDWVRRYLAREMYIFAFDSEESDRVFAETDPEIARAVEALPRATTLVQSSRKMVAERHSPHPAAAAAAARQ
jgi:carboxyl-terminal processing protease